MKDNTSPQKKIIVKINLDDWANDFVIKDSELNTRGTRAYEVYHYDSLPKWDEETCLNVFEQLIGDSQNLLVDAVHRGIKVTYGYQDKTANAKSPTKGVLSPSSASSITSPRLGAGSDNITESNYAFRLGRGSSGEKGIHGKEYGSYYFRDTELEAYYDYNQSEKKTFIEKKISDFLKSWDENDRSLLEKISNNYKELKNSLPSQDHLIDAIIAFNASKAARLNDVVGSNRQPKNSLYEYIESCNLLSDYSKPLDSLNEVLRDFTASKMADILLEQAVAKNLTFTKQSKEVLHKAFTKLFLEQIAETLHLEIRRPNKVYTTDKLKNAVAKYRDICEVIDTRAQNNQTQSPEELLESTKRNLLHESEGQLLEIIWEARPDIEGLKKKKVTIITEEEALEVFRQAQDIILDRSVSKLSPESQLDIAKKFAYTLEIDYMQISNKDNWVYAHKKPSLQKFESKFFDSKAFREKFLTYNDQGQIRHTLLTEDQFKIVKDFEEILSDILNPNQTPKRRKPTVMLDTGEGKTFMAELFRKYEDEIRHSNILGHENFTGIVHINLANKAMLDAPSDQSLKGKIYIIDEDFFIEGISEKLRQLVDRDAKVMRFGASQGLLIQEAGRVRHELKANLGNDERVEKELAQDFKKISEKIVKRREALKGKLLQSDIVFNKQLNSRNVQDNWHELPWEGSGSKHQTAKTAQYLIPELKFDNTDARKQQLSAFANNTEVDFAVINFIEGGRHACVVFDPTNGNFSNYWLESECVKNDGFGSLEDFKKLSKELFDHQRQNGLKIATIYAGNPEFIVGGDYAAVSVLNEFDEQKIIITDDEQINLDLLKQMVGRNRQTNPEVQTPLKVYSGFNEHFFSKGDFIKHAQKQTDNKDRLDLLRNFESKVRRNLGSEASGIITKFEGDIPKFGDDDYDKLISGRYYVDEAGKKVRKIFQSFDYGEQNKYPKPIADLRNYLFFKKICLDDGSIDKNALSQILRRYWMQIGCLKGLMISYEALEDSDAQKQLESRKLLQYLTSKEGELDGLMAVEWSTHPERLLEIPNLLTFTTEQLNILTWVEKKRNEAQKNQKQDDQEEFNIIRIENAELNGRLINSQEHVRQLELLLEEKRKNFEELGKEALRIKDESIATNENLKRQFIQEQLNSAKKQQEAFERYKLGVETELKKAKDSEREIAQEIILVRRENENLKQECTGSLAELEDSRKQASDATVGWNKSESKSKSLSENLASQKEILVRLEKELQNQKLVQEENCRLNELIHKAESKIVELQRKLDEAGQELREMFRAKTEAEEELEEHRMKELRKGQFSADDPSHFKWSEEEDIRIKVSEEGLKCSLPLVEIDDNDPTTNSPEDPTATMIVDPLGIEQPRGQKFRYLKSVFGHVEDAKKTIENIFLSAVQLSQVDIELVIKVVEGAQKADREKEGKGMGVGEYAKKLYDNRKIGDEQLEQIKEFSRHFQNNTELCGIYSGRKEGDLKENRLVGLRSRFIPAEVLNVFRDKNPHDDWKAEAVKQVLEKTEEVKNVLLSQNVASR